MMRFSSGKIDDHLEKVQYLRFPLHGEIPSANDVPQVLLIYGGFSGAIDTRYPEKSGHWSEY